MINAVDEKTESSETAPVDADASDEQEIFTEAEAAAFLRLKQHILVDVRREGKIRASQIVGRRIRYRREWLIEYLESRPYVPRSQKKAAEMAEPSASSAS